LVEAREILDIPVLGFLETTALVSCMMGRTFSLITPNPKFALSFEQKLKLYGLTERLTSIETMNIPHLPDYRQAFIDPAAHQRVMDEFDQAARRAVAAGAEVLIPCGSHSVLPGASRRERNRRRLDHRWPGRPDKDGGNGGKAAKNHGNRGQPENAVPDARARDS
jgi:hypothetical protein